MCWRSKNTSNVSKIGKVASLISGKFMFALDMFDCRWLWSPQL